MSETQLHGPKFVEWLEQEGVLGLDLPEYVKDRIYHRVKQWRQGHNAMLDTADRLMLSLDRHLSEVPEDLFIVPPPRPGRKPAYALTEEQKDRLHYAFLRGVPTDEVAHALELPRQVVNNERRRWRNART